MHFPDRFREAGAVVSGHFDGSAPIVAVESAKIGSARSIADEGAAAFGSIMERRHRWLCKARNGLEVQPTSFTPKSVLILLNLRTNSMAPACKPRASAHSCGIGPRQ